jgi:hypothetical protein
MGPNVYIISTPEGALLGAFSNWEDALKFARVRVNGMGRSLTAVMPLTNDSNPVAWDIMDGNDWVLLMTRKEV